VARPTADDLFARHHRDVYRYLVRMTGRRDEADDLSQDVFLRVVRALENGGPPGHERAWVFSIARNLLADRWRQDQRRGIEVEQVLEPAAEGTQALAVGLAEALGRLPDADREMFLLREIGGLSYQELAAVSDSTVEAVRARLWRARSALRRLLSL